MSILLQNVILNKEKRDVYIEDNRIAQIAPMINKGAEQKIDGMGRKAVAPGLVNSHTHAAMTLLRGVGDDLPLQEWLEKKMWPLEAKLTEEDIYWGTKLACLEMLKNGTTCFNDMYWHEEAAVEAIKEMGLRAVVGLVLLDTCPVRSSVSNGVDSKGSKENIEKLYGSLSPELPSNIALSIAPHAIYTVCRKNLIWAKNFATEHNLLLHIHISETEKEVRDCKEKTGLRPVEYLDKINFLGSNTVLAHSVWLSQQEIETLGARGCSVVYCPTSNMKLAVGQVLPYPGLKKADVNVALGTDGPASNNNLDLLEEAKIGSLLQKQHCKDQTVARAEEALQWATLNGVRALKIDAGSISEGKLADLILVDLDHHCFAPGHNFASDIVYCASGECVCDVICNGKILMRNRKVEDEVKIISHAFTRAKNLTK